MDQIQATVKKIDVLPMVKYYIDQLNLYDLFAKYVPKPERSPIEPAQILSIIVMNIICCSHPLYKIEEWIADYTDGLCELPQNASIYNDDQLGKNLDRLFFADRNSFMTELTTAAIKIHNLMTNRIHNDSTSITFQGKYEINDPEAVKLDFGFNKDHRPDCKQIVFGLNITADGHVPLSYNLFDGNQSDDPTHIPNWDELRTLLGKKDFIYIADCKLCSAKNLDHIDANHGFFITIVPKNRKDLISFLELLKSESLQWEYAYKKENSRKKGKFDVYHTYEYNTTEKGYRIIWVHSSAKQEQDENRRTNVISKIEKKLKELEPKLNRYSLKTKGKIKKAITKACKGGREYFKTQLIENKEIFERQASPGRPGPNTVYKKVVNISYSLKWSLNEEAIEDKSRTDGIFPLITNTEMEASQVLISYKKQPFLEKRMYTTKSILEIAPVFLKKPRRIEAITFLYFIGLMIVSLIERSIRKKMNEEKIDKLPILPNRMNTAHPTWNNMSYFFRNVHLSVITESEKISQMIVKGITDVHEIVLRLLEVPLSVYKKLRDRWWIFKEHITPIPRIQHNYGKPI